VCEVIVFDFSSIAIDRESSRDDIEPSETNHPQAKSDKHEVVTKARTDANDFTPLRDLIRLLDRAI
jgi:hypothetical protein